MPSAAPVETQRGMCFHLLSVELKCIFTLK